MWSSVWIPLLIVLATVSFRNTTRRNNPHNGTRLVHMAAALGAFVMAIGLSEGTTVLLKLWVQRRRPNFYSLCGFEKQVLKCTAPDDLVMEANLSFPSGHSSLSCCGSTFLVWYFFGVNADKLFETNSNSKRMMVRERLAGRKDFFSE